MFHEESFVFVLKDIFCLTIDKKQVFKTKQKMNIFLL